MAEPLEMPPFTSTMAALHRVFRTSLGSSPVLISSADGSDARRTLIADYYTNVLAFLEVHHEHEEAHVFAILSERAPDEKARVARAIEQHREVGPLLAAAQAAVEVWAAGDDTGGGRVVGCLEALGESLSVHLDDEEAMLASLEEKYLTPEDTSGDMGIEDFKGDKIWLIFGLVLENMSDEQRAELSEQTPPALREWWETTGEPSFNDMISKVRQTTDSSR